MQHNAKPAPRCGFASTNLDFILRQRGIQHVALGGFLTNCCVESTMRRCVCLLACLLACLRGLLRVVCSG